MVRKGWRGQSARHSLAARGVKTGRKPKLLTHVNIEKVIEGGGNVHQMLALEHDARYKKALAAWFEGRDIKKAKLAVDSLMAWEERAVDSTEMKMMTGMHRQSLELDWDGKMEAVTEFLDIMESWDALGMERTVATERERLAHLEYEAMLRRRD